jgi:tRNA A37 threonylcarbamoyladenosine modification protein TsaB
MILSFDTSVIKVVRIRIDDRMKLKRLTLRGYADRALTKVTALLRGKKPERIGVVAGPGAFTATRTGVIFANALAYAWSVPAVSLTKEQFDSKNPIPRGSKKSVSVIYGMPPNITVRKKK